MEKINLKCTIAFLSEATGISIGDIENALRKYKMTSYFMQENTLYEVKMVNPAYYLGHFGTKLPRLIFELYFYTGKRTRKFTLYTLVFIKNGVETETFHVTSFKKASGRTVTAYKKPRLEPLESNE